MGNTSLLCPHQAVVQSYQGVMRHLKEVISTGSAESLNDSSYNVSRYKVECFTFVTNNTSIDD